MSSFDLSARHSVDRLNQELGAAIATATEAYRQSAGLVRVLTVLGQPTSSEELSEEAMVALSEVFAADVVATTRVVSHRMMVTVSCGVPEGDAAYTEGWPVTGAAAEAISTGRPVARAGAELDMELDVPDSLAEIHPGSAVWLPVNDGAPVVDELLVLFRHSRDPFTATELQILGTVAVRLRLAVQARERGAQAERLARFGHRLARLLDLPSLYDEVVKLLPPLVGADGAVMVDLRDGQAMLRAASGIEELPEVGPAEVLWGWSDLVRGEPVTGTCQTPDGRGVELLGVPVIRDGGPDAVLYALRHDGRPFLKDTVESATIFANYVSAAVTNAELYRAVGEHEASLRLITDAISDLVAVVDTAGRFRYASPSHEREVGHPPERLVGTPVLELTHPQDTPALAAALADPAGSPKVEYRFRTGDGGWVWVETALRPAPSADDTVVLSSRVIDDRRRLEEELRRRASHDPLTELANRALTMEKLEEALSGRPSAGRGGEPAHVGLLFCDLDKFKDVNDRLGHDVGDELLLAVADRLRGCVRPDDLLARFGGDEFVIVLSRVRDLHQVTEIGERIVRAVSAPYLLRGERVEVSISIGGVLGTPGESGAGAMLRDADAAMYVAKNSGRGRIEVFDDLASHRSLERLELASDLTRALERDELSLAYQPIVDLADGRIIGFEALARWHHPARGPVRPDVFIPLAEETGEIVNIGAWVLRRACRQLARWHRVPGGDHLRISVNLSATQLQQADLANCTLEIISESGVRPSDVWLEITEHSSIRTDVTEFATTMRAAGVHFALDDFGISYSNLGHLKRLPVEILKIDRSFVDGLTAKDTDRGIVRAVLVIADSLGLAVVAEGIETADQRAELLTLGCGQGQGYLFSRPLSAEDATALLAVGQLGPAVSDRSGTDRSGALVS